MGVDNLGHIERYWNIDPDTGGVFELVSEAISLVRWQQINRYLYCFVCPEDQVLQPIKGLRPFDKVDKLAAHLIPLFSKYWAPGRDLAIDEAIQGFCGRARETVNIPSKPTPIGYKMWVVADAGYVISWLWHARGSRKIDGPQGLLPDWDDQAISKTQRVVLTLMRHVPNKGIDHLLVIDNLFTSQKLLKLLRADGIGGCGTVRTTTTKRERQEAMQRCKVSYTALLTRISTNLYEKIVPRRG